MKYIILIMIIFINLFANNINILDVNETNRTVRVDVTFKKPNSSNVIVSIKKNNNTIATKSVKYLKNDIQTSVYFLIDTSIPKRIAFEKGIKPLIENIMSNLKSKKYNIAISGFDKKIKIIKSFKDKFDIKELDKLKIAGQRTALYRLLLKAIDVLTKQHTKRKILVLISDGDFEDTAYNIEDLILKAKKDKIMILSLGYRGLIKTQGIQRPAVETHGKLWVANKITHKMDKNFLNEFLPYLNNGTFIKFNKKFSATIDGKKELSLIANRGDENYTKQSSINVDKKSSKEGVHYIILLIIIIILIMALILFFLFKKQENKKNDNTIVEKIDKNIVKKQIYPLAYLVNQAGKQLPITKPNTSIGRNKDNDIVIVGSYISGYHADIIVKHNEFFISDKNSTNGISINTPIEKQNKHKIMQSKLNNGDTIYLGPLKLKFKIN